MHAGDDTDPFASFLEPVDPIGLSAHDDHPGVVALREAARQLDDGDAAAALASATSARAAGVPSELAPHLAVIEGCAAVANRTPGGATARLSDAWQAHPDVAALPAVLGIAQLLGGDATSAAHTMYAALVSDDPDRSIAVHRRRLTQLLRVVRESR